MKVIGKGLERPNRFLVAIWADGRNMYRRANIDRRRGRMEPDQISRIYETASSEPLC